MTAILIYGATGYTGQLLAAHAVAQGLRPILAGRDPDKLRPLAAGWAWRCGPRASTTAQVCARRSRAWRR